LIGIGLNQFDHVRLILGPPSGQLELDRRVGAVTPIRRPRTTRLRMNRSERCIGRNQA
jgi:hypothetical protein